MIIYNFRKVNCDPLMKIKRRIGYILLEEFCATSDKQLLGKRNRKEHTDSSRNTGS